MEHSKTIDQRVSKTLSDYNSWRRGDDSDQLEPYVIGLALDNACARLSFLANPLTFSGQWKRITGEPTCSPCLITDGIKVEKARWDKEKKMWVLPNPRTRITPTHYAAMPSLEKDLK
jgi:hypothetical protein